MSERVPASFQIGGRISQKDLETYINLINNRYALLEKFDGGPADFNNAGETFGDYEVSWGDLTVLEEFAVEHRLHYLFWFDCGSEWGEQSIRYDPNKGKVRVARICGTPHFSLHDLKTRSVEDLILEAKWVDSPLPPLELVS